MVQVGEYLWCTYMASELKDATYLEDKLNTLAKSCNLFYNRSKEIDPHPATTQICYAFRGVYKVNNIYLFPSEGNILGVAMLNNAQASFKSFDGNKTEIKLEEITVTIFRDYLTTPKIVNTQNPGFYPTPEPSTKK